MTDRITPLPWSLKECRDGVYAGLKCIIGAENKEIMGVRQIGYPQHENVEANAAYIVHACNNYPKLEALNAELVKEVRELVTFIEYLRKNEGVTLGADFVESGKALLEKAKGVANVL
jgi:hypothetical protein